MKKRNNIRMYFIIATLFITMSCCGSPSDGSTNGVNKYTEVVYEQSNGIFPNPERGFMHMFSVNSEGQGLDLSQLKALKNENVTLAQRVYYFEKFRDAPLSSAQLSLMQSDMEKIREAGVKVILGFAYTGIDYVYYTDNGEDAPYSVIETHLDQLKPFFEENKDVIAFVQAGFIGAWGEWHSSTNGLETPYYRKAVLEKMLSVIPAEIMVSVRTPRYKQEIFGTSVPITGDMAYTDNYRARVGHHNHCFMASIDDYGTYLDVETEKTYISQEGLYVPTGGETCPPVPDDYPTGCEVARTTMRLLRWTYLNLDWYKPTLDGWRNSGCFDEFQRELGYRLKLSNARFTKELAVDKKFELNMTMTNLGYAPLYNYKPTSLVLKNSDWGEYHEFQLSTDLRNCKPLTELNIEGTISLGDLPAGNYALFLKISDKDEKLKKRSDYSIRLANNNVWTEENGGMNNLNYQLKIN